MTNPTDRERAGRVQNEIMDEAIDAPSNVMIKYGVFGDILRSEFTAIRTEERKKAAEYLRGIAQELFDHLGDGYAPAVNLMHFASRIEKGEWDD